MAKLIKIKSSLWLFIILFLLLNTSCKRKFNFKNQIVYLVTNREKSSFKNQFRNRVGEKNLWMNVHTGNGRYDYKDQLQKDFFNKFFHQVNGKDIIVYIHGSGKSIKTVTKRSIRLKTIYGKPVLAFDWATHKTPGPLVYRKSRAKAKQSAEYLMRFLNELFQYKRKFYPKVRIHLLMHSLGNHVYESLVALEKYDPKLHPFQSIIFSAADIIEEDQKLLFKKLKKMDSNIFIFFNEGDFVLWWAQFFIWKDRLGKRADRPKDENHIKFVDLSSAKKVGHRHEYLFHPSDNIFKLIQNILSGEIPDKDVELKKKNNIWILK